MSGRVIIGTAGWAIPRGSVHRTSVDGTHLQRYARLFTGVEINSSFYRPHRIATYRKWAASTPPGFRLAVKVPRSITHDHRLRLTRVALDRFLEEASGLGDKRGPLLVQLPPSLAFNGRVATQFFELLRRRDTGAVVCEPRHPTWFSPDANALLVRYDVARVAADPAVVPEAAEPGGWSGLVYVRLHGSPRMYWSRYDEQYIQALSERIARIAESRDVWVMFDNTAMGTAFENAWELLEATRVGARSRA